MKDHDISALQSWASVCKTTQRPNISTFATEVQDNSPFLDPPSTPLDPTYYIPMIWDHVLFFEGTRRALALCIKELPQTLTLFS